MTFNNIICNLKTIKMMKNKRHNTFITAKKHKQIKAFRDKSLSKCVLFERMLCGFSKSSLDNFYYTFYYIDLISLGELN